MISSNLFHRSVMRINILGIRNYTYKNILCLNDRGFFQDTFPDNASQQIGKLLTTQRQTIYAGFDPTANSLHVGNLLVVMGLIHCQRSGHQPIALIGGATGLIGDPSGRNNERDAMAKSVMDENIIAITEQIQRIFNNHKEYFWKTNKKSTDIQLKDVKIVNNADWFSNVKLIEFISTIGRHFRMGSMLSRSSVQSRLKSEDGMSFTEFTYQMFQAYDWLHLYQSFNCKFQLGGSDQMGNLMSGHELISRVCEKPVYGFTLPIITNEEGNKFGKSAGNAIWLNESKTSAFSLYQFFIRIADSEVEHLLKLLTFLSIEEIADIVEKHHKQPELRVAQRKLAQEITLLIHGNKGLEKAESISQALYTGSIDALARLSKADIAQSFAGATVCDLYLESGMSVLDLAMKSKCFTNEHDAIRIISAGGFYLNQMRAQNISEVITQSVHVLKNGLTLLRVGKKNYYLINWIK